MYSAIFLNDLFLLLPKLANNCPDGVTLSVLVSLSAVGGNMCTFTSATFFSTCSLHKEEYPKW